MKKTLLIACMSLVLVVSVVAVVQAGGHNAAQACKDNFLVQAGILDFNTCVVCNNNGNGNGAACVCKAVDDLGLLDVLGFKNLGQCVKAFG